MRRIALAAAISLVIAGTSIGLAAARTFTGVILGGVGGQGASITFKTAPKSGPARTVKQFAWANIAATCREGTTSTSGTLGKSMRVRRKTRSFHGTLLSADGGKVQVTGRFKGSKKAVGLFTMRNWTIDASHTACSAGALSWSAR